MVAIRGVVAVELETRLGVREDEAPKVADEVLDSGAQVDHVVVRAHVRELPVGEELLEGHVAVDPIGAAADVVVDEPGLPGGQVVHVEHR